MKRIHAPVPDKTFDDFQAACATANMPMSHVLAKLMDAEVKRPTVTAKPRPTRPKPAKIDPSTHENRMEEIRVRNIEIARLVDDGVRYADIAARFGISKAGVCRALKRMAV